MKEQMLLRPHLLNKFDELPVNGNSVADWKKMEQALQLAMPIGLLSVVLFGKGWLLSKKMLWLWISIATCGGAATTLAVYQSRQANLAQTEPLVNKHNKPIKGGPVLSVIAPAVKDTTVNKKKHKINKTVKSITNKNQLPTMAEWYDAAVNNKNPRLNRYSTDTSIGLFKSLKPVKVFKDSLGRTFTFKSIKPVKVFKDSLGRTFKSLKPVKVFKDSLGWTFKSLKPVKGLKDSLGLTFKSLKPAKVFKDSLGRTFKSLKPVKVMKDSFSLSLKNSKRIGYPGDTSFRFSKNLKPVKLLKNGAGKPVKSLKPVKILKDSLVRPLKP
ncbi:hypothetical protein ACFQZS_10825 [Mucilaginibacter calamicampi]|uniref:Uncharacterized protein n=1 Tax=Mucilaginibacter calamicampi TaxID=1302352 RepID=A0ABW2YYI8_9SPHI